MRVWPNNFSALDIELACYRHRLSVEDGGLGPVQHFINAANLVWPPGSKAHITWHPWALQMITKAIELQELPNSKNSLAVAGAASAGKSYIFGAYGIINWLCIPDETMVLVTSTSLKESRKRIWGVICKLFSHAAVKLPGKLVDSQGSIRTLIPGMKPNDMSGIHLIAGEKKKEQAAIDKMIGIKAARVFLIADELTALSPAVVEAGANLSNNPFYQMVGLGNSNSIYDPHGVLSEPVNGWKSIDVTREDGWETRSGYCLRFDAEKSPNYVTGNAVVPFMPTREMVDQAREKFGEKSRAYYRMFRSIWFADDEDAGIFSEADLVRAKHTANIIWREPPTPVAGLDLGYSNHGDRTILIHGLCGFDMDGIPRLQLQGYYRLLEDASLKTVPRNFQIARQVRDLCQKHGIDVRFLGVDGTGAAGSFIDILVNEWKKGALSVIFGGWPSDRDVVHNGKTLPAGEVYANRVSEMWGEARRYIHYGQVSGIFNELAQELTTRKFTERNRSGAVLLAVENKLELRKRTGKSCDIADAFLVLMDLCRSRCKFRAKRVPLESDSYRRVVTDGSGHVQSVLRLDGKNEPIKDTRGSKNREKWKKLLNKVDVDRRSQNFLMDERANPFSIW